MGFPVRWNSRSSSWARLMASENMMTVRQLVYKSTRKRCETIRKISHIKEGGFFESLMHFFVTTITYHLMGESCSFAERNRHLFCFPFSCANFGYNLRRQRICNGELPFTQNSTGCCHTSHIADIISRQFLPRNFPLCGNIVQDFLSCFGRDLFPFRLRHCFFLLLVYLCFV